MRSRSGFPSSLRPAVRRAPYPFGSAAASFLKFTRRRGDAEKVAGKALLFFASASPQVMARYARAAKCLGPI